MAVKPHYSASQKQVVDPTNKYFKPKLCVAWLIGVRDYSKVRGAQIAAVPDRKDFCEDID